MSCQACRQFTFTACWGHATGQRVLPKAAEPRSINREKLLLPAVLSALEDPQTLCHQIFFATLKLIEIRRCQPAFHPNAAFDVLSVDPRLLAIRRTRDDQILYALINVSAQVVTASLTASGATRLLERSAQR